MYSLAVRSIGGRSPAGAPPFLDRSGDVVPLSPPTAADLAAFSHFGFMYSNSPSRPPSRPNPLSRYPPKPAAASNRLVLFTHTVPAFTFGATSRARLMFSVQMEAASP
jgi:hypothetical protein